jgi:hypothetical protein
VNHIRLMLVVLVTMFFMFCAVPLSRAPIVSVPKIPLYDLFEINIINPTTYDNPFADVELNAVFVSPAGRRIHFFGFYDGEAQHGRRGGVWRQRFMPDEVGMWTYTLTFSDGQPGESGRVLP